MGKMKRTLILTLVWNLLLSVMVFAALATDKLTASGVCGKQVTWRLTGDGTLTISGTGAMTDYSAYAGTPFQKVAEDIKQVVVEKGVTRIGTYSFYQCNSLTGVVLPDTVSEIGDYAFDHCASLISLTIPQKVTRIGAHTFHGCSNLTEVVIPKGVIVIGESAFADCTSLTGLTLPESLTVIGERAFFSCKSLTSVTIPQKVTALEQYAFAWCWGLQSIHFQGDAPAFSDSCFWDTKTTAYYPEGNQTWTAEKKQNYDGTITWRSEVTACAHENTWRENEKQATCTQAGYTGDVLCVHCGKLLKTGTAIPLLAHSWDADGVCTECGKNNGVIQTERLAGAHRYETAFLAADRMKEALGVEKFETVVVASGVDFADALSGSYLAARKNAPILLACQTEWVNDLVKSYIRKNLAPGGTVYILGGENAVPASFKTGLYGFRVSRLAGENRFQTNLKVLLEAGVEDKPILVCTGGDFADSLSASATKLPILLVYGNLLREEQAVFLEAECSGVLYILGGTGAVSGSLEQALLKYGQVQRLEGKDRFETSVLIAKTFFAKPNSVVLAYAGDFPDGLCGGALAAAMGAPLLLTMPNYERKATDYVQSGAIRRGVILGGTGLIPDKSVNSIFGIQ